MPATILLVDDDIATRVSLRFALEDFGYNVIDASEGHQGLQCYRRSSVDIVITDIHMPGMDGLEMIQAIQQYDPTAIAIAMSASREQLSLARHVGAQQTLEKPLDLSELCHVLDTWLETRPQAIMN